jgi:leucyl aminopeptidase
MEIKLVPANVALKTGALIIPIFEGETSQFVPQDLSDSGEIAAKPLEFTLLHKSGEAGPRRILLAGCGKTSSFGPAEFRKVIAAAIRFLKGKAISDAAVLLPESLSTPANAAAVVESAILGNYEPDQNKSDKTSSKFIETFTLSASGVGLESAAEEARILAEAQNAARTLGNEPPNKLTPLALAAHAQKMADEFGLGCEILDRERMKQLGFGALLGVAMGSAEPPALIILRYVPAGVTTATGAHLGLVGKAVTFDSGGISIKPADGMEQMKFDMMGGATIISAMQAIAQLKPSIPVTAVVACVENMLGGRAQRPSDIVTKLCGKTVEVLNTDAEGRMILADALTYTQRLGCTHMVNAATLTGAIVVALGHTFTGVFGNDEALIERWMNASVSEQERMWKMPIDEDFKDRLKSSFADMQNIGGRYGGASIAANFLKEFADPTPWVHLDIAGTAWLEESKTWMAKGATGCPTRTFVRLAMDWK